MTQFCMICSVISYNDTKNDGPREDLTARTWEGTKNQGHTQMDLLWQTETFGRVYIDLTVNCSIIVWFLLFIFSLILLTDSTCTICWSCHVPYMTVGFRMQMNPGWRFGPVGLSAGFRGSRVTEAAVPSPRWTSSSNRGVHLVDTVVFNVRLHFWLQFVPLPFFTFETFIQIMKVPIYFKQL